MTQSTVREAVRELRLSGRPLCVHSSLRSFGLVEGGAERAVQCLLAEGCTVLVPTFSDAYAILPPPDMRPERNGWDYTHMRASPCASLMFSPDSCEVDRDMGAISAAVLAMPERVRGNHPLNSFSAVGPLGEALVRGQSPLDPYAPLRALADAGGAVVLMGVGFDSLTSVHLAEQMAGRNLFRRWANDSTGKPTMVAVGGCSDGFAKLEPVLGPLLREATVGASPWKIISPL